MKKEDRVTPLEVTRISFTSRKQFTSKSFVIFVPMLLVCNKRTYFQDGTGYCLTRLKTLAKIIPACLGNTKIVHSYICVYIHILNNKFLSVQCGKVLLMRDLGCLTQDE